MFTCGPPAAPPGPGTAERRPAAPAASAGGLEVTFAEATADAHADIDAAYHAKYDCYGLTIVGHVTGADAEAVTIRLIRKDTSDGHQ